MVGFTPLGGAPLGSSGTVTRDFTLLVEGAALALQPGSAQFVHAWRLAITGADLAVEPGEAIFSRHGVVRVSPAALALEPGTARFLPHNRTLVTGTSLSLEPGSALFRPTQYLRVTPASLALEPGAALIRSHRRLTVTGADLAIDPGEPDLVFEHGIAVTSADLAIAAGSATFRATHKTIVTGAALAIQAGSAGFISFKNPPLPARQPRDYGVLVHLRPLDPATGERVDIYASSFGKRGEAVVNGYDGKVWEPCITQRPKIGITLWNGDFTDDIATAGASLPLNLEILRETYPDAPRLAWTGAPIEIHIGRAADAWPWANTFKGLIRSYGGAYPTIALQASVNTEAFETDVLSRTYAGTGGIEGGTDLKNRLKPLILGWAENVEPVLINEIDSIYQFSGYGPMEQVTTLYERGSDFGASIGDYAAYSTLLAATIPPGRWATCLSQGLIRLGAPAAGVITGDVKGHIVGSATPRPTDKVISALATLCGIAPDNIDATSLAALNADKPYPINVVITEQASFLAWARRLARAANWQAGIGLDGQLFFNTPDPSATQSLTLHTLGRALPQVTVSEEIDVSPPFYKTTMGAARSWRVHTADEVELGYDIAPTGRYSDTRTYRLGNTINLIDGSEWVYINETPSAGNPPPAWPTTSNAWWENITPPSDTLSAQVAIRTAALRNPRDNSNVARSVLLATTTGTTSTISIAKHDWDYPNGNDDVTRVMGTISGLMPNMEYFVYFDDLTLADTNPTYLFALAFEASMNSSEHPGRHPLGSIRTPQLGAPQTQGGGVPGYNYEILRTVDEMSSDFYARNDRNPAPIPGATIATNGTAVDHTLGINGSADISFEWHRNTVIGEIDGQEVMIYASTSSAPYTPGSAPYAEAVANVSPDREAITIQGVNPTYNYTFAHRSYRDVDPDVDPSGRIYSPWVKPSLSSENPYRPEINVAWAGNVTGTINGTSAANVATWSSYASYGLNPDGSVRPSKVNTDSVLNQALVAAGYATQSALLTMSPGETVNWGMISSQYVANGKRIVVDMNINYLLYITNPVQTGYYGASFYIVLQGPYGSYLSNEDYQHIQWEAPSASGSFITDRKTLSLQFVFNNVPPGYYSAAYRIVCPGTNGLWTFPYRYMKMNELKATE